MLRNPETLSAANYLVTALDGLVSLIEKMTKETNPNPKQTKLLLEECRDLRIMSQTEIEYIGCLCGKASNMMARLYIISNSPALPIDREPLIERTNVFARSVIDLIAASSNAV